MLHSMSPTKFGHHFAGGVFRWVGLRLLSISITTALRTCTLRAPGEHRYTDLRSHRYDVHNHSGPLSPVLPNFGGVYARQCLVLYHIRPNVYVTIGHPIDKKNNPQMSRSVCDRCHDEIWDRDSGVKRKWDFLFLFRFISKQIKHSTCKVCRGFKENENEQGPSYQIVDAFELGDATT